MKKFSQVKQYDGICCSQASIKDKILNDDLKCIICFQIMTKPVKLACKSNHTFGLACIKQWTKIKPNTMPKCPYCRQPVQNWCLNQQLSSEVGKMIGKCTYCLNWQGKLQRLFTHQNNCQKYYQFLKNQLKTTVQQQIKVLDIQINLHLNSQHQQIYQKYVQNWQWLYQDLRNWKWWWWASNKWWQNKTCAECNVLWHRYQKTIDMLEQKRINLISLLNERFVQFQIKNLFD